jgi:hypothetical protein
MPKLNFSVSRVFDHIPQELKDTPQWLVWRYVVGRDGTATKMPYQPRYPRLLADVRNELTFSSFAEAREALIASGNGAASGSSGGDRGSSASASGAGLAGVGFSFTRKDEFSGIDFDDITKVAPEHLERRLNWERRALALATYIETSPSGRGFHVIIKGTVPGGIGGRRDSKLEIEAYSWDRFFTVTGLVQGEKNSITDQQGFLDELVADIDRYSGAKQSLAYGDGLPGDTTEAERRIDYSDEELLRAIELWDRSGRFHKVFVGEDLSSPGRWSDGFFYLIAMLDQFSGNVGQVERVALNSPFVLESAPSRSSEPRNKKAKRTLAATYARARATNDATYRERQVGRANANALMDSLRKVEDVADELSSNASALLDAFPLDKKHKKISRPSGVMGEFIAATERAMFHPYTKFAIPATLASIAGVVGRGYKFLDGSGLNVSFILAAPSSTGKTQTQNAWQKFVSRANADVQVGKYDVKSPERIINAGTSSIQGIYEDFMRSPSCAWFIEECSAQLRKMSNPKSTVDEQFRDSFNEFYGAGSIYGRFTPPRSVTSKKSNYDPIPNLSVSIYWTLPLAKFDMFTDDVLDGFLSRVIAIRHKGSAGLFVSEDQIEAELPQTLHERLVLLLSRARELDEVYERTQGAFDEVSKKITPVQFDPTAMELIAEVLKITEEVKIKALENEIPETYVVVARLPVNAKRIAGLLAIAENPFAPMVTVDQYQWAFGYLLQCTVELMSDFDKGKIGHVASDEYVVIGRAIKELIKGSKENRSGVGRTDLRRVVMNRKPFAPLAWLPSSGSERFTKALDNMIREGLVVSQKEQGRKGAPKELLLPGDDEKFWRSC